MKNIINVLSFKPIIKKEVIRNTLAGPTQNELIKIMKGTGITLSEVKWSDFEKVKAKKVKST